MPTQNSPDEIKHSAWSIFIGILTAALGLFLIAYPLVIAAITTSLLGWVLIFIGLAQFIFALHSRRIGDFFLSFLYGICGVALAFFPMAGLAALMGVSGAFRWPFSYVWVIGVVLGISIFMSGISRIMIATQGEVAPQRLNGSFSYQHGHEHRALEGEPSHGFWIRSLLGIIVSSIETWI
jgi:uncharacterized membrane protein HdeD (DUF308 family)